MSIPESCVIDWLDAEGTVEAHAARDLIESMQNRLNAYEKGVQADIARSMIKTSDQLNVRVAELEQQLAASQARERALRDALSFIANNLGEYAGAMQTQQQADVLTSYADVAFAALAQPFDDTDLMGLLKGLQEHIASQFDGKDEMFGDTIADIIREMEYEDISISEAPNAGASGSTARLGGILMPPNTA